MVGLDPTDDTGRRRVLAPVKTNLGEMPESLAYHLATDQLRGCARIVSDGASAHKAAVLLAEPDDPEARSERDEAAAWLTGYLTDNGCEACAGDVFKAGRADGRAERTLKRARTRLGVTSRAAGFGKGTVWAFGPSGPPSGPCGPVPEHGPDGPDGPDGAATTQRAKDAKPGTVGTVGKADRTHRGKDASPSTVGTVGRQVPP
jgi:hypothetical protein